jgi:cell division septation protein DedD
MYKDFKQSGSLDTGLVGGNGIIWMFSGVILGLLVGLGMYYFANKKAPTLSSVDLVQKKIATAQAQKKRAIPSQLVQNRHKQLSNTQQPRRNNFSYYAVLPTLDVPVGSAKPIKTVLKNHKLDGLNEDTANKVALLEADDVQADTLSANEQGFMIQVASFKHKSRANKAIKLLSKKGVKAFVQQKKVKGRIWYRVIAGPINSDSVDGWKLAAEKLGHRPMVISVR